MRQTIRLYASTGEVKTPAERISEVEERYREGFRAVKLQVHAFDEAEDIRHVVETARAVGDRVKVGVDANQGWRVTIVSDALLWDLARAERLAEAYANAGVAWIEEPLPMDGYDDLAALTAYSQIPIAGGELVGGSGRPRSRSSWSRAAARKGLLCTARTRDTEADGTSRRGLRIIVRHQACQP